LELLEEQGFDKKENDGFTINEIDAMYSANQLDMEFNHTDNGKKIYVKYNLSSKNMVRARPSAFDDIIEDLFSIENILTKQDTLIIIMDDEPNDTLIAKLKYIFEHEGIFVVVHNIKRLQYNILNHVLVPKCSILNDTEIEDLKKKYSLKSVSQLPEISRFDPQALAMCLRPGQICKFERDSATALNYDYYRICIQ
jgi:DNA-directed RNA polymerase subunit H (RpoH/RPB5)/nitrate reductase NapAB chaperone NapD